MTFLDYQRHQVWWNILFFGSAILLDVSINATSVLMEHRLAGKPTAVWEPFAWEFTSALSFVLLLPFIFSFGRRYPLGWGCWRSNGWRHILFSVLISIGHVLIMFGLRWLVYFAVGWQYQPDEWGWVFVYEYRKDLMTYFLILAISYTHRFIVGRLAGEAAFIDEGEENETRVSERFLVKKLGKEFVIQLTDVDWMEAAGNYVNLHVKERVYPVRTTMAQMASDIVGRPFCRIHRSVLVNLTRIAHIETLDSGDATVTLHSGQSLKMSRRYRAQLKANMR